ncbi:MAG: hypothetical protein ACI4J5_05910 [Oscillospiraceae bacterium]
MILHVIAGAAFGVTIILAAKDIPPKTRLSAVIAGTVLAAADIFMLTRFAAASGEYEELLLFLNENRQASLDMLPGFMSSFAAGIHNVIITAAEQLQSANGVLCGFFGSTADIIAFGGAALIVSMALIMLVPDKDEPDTDTVDTAKVVGMMILDLFTDSFFAAPIAALAAYGACRLIGVEYTAVICTVMWVLSYIPVIGQAAGIILGVCILVAACHPIWGIIFGIFSALLYVLLSNGKNIITGLMEVREQEKQKED